MVNLGGPLRGQGTNLQGKYHYGISTPTDLINDLRTRMGFTQSSITNYAQQFMDWDPNKAEYVRTGASDAATASANERARLVTNQLKNLSEASLKKLQIETRRGKGPAGSSLTNQLNGSDLDRSMVDKYLGTLALQNKTIEQPFLGPQLRTHPLNDLLAGAAQAGISGGIPIDQLSRSLNLIKGMKGNYGTGASMLGGIQNLTGAAAAASFKKNLTESKILGTYQTQTEGIDSNALGLTGKFGIRARRNAFLKKVSDTGDPLQIALASEIVPGIGNNEAMNEVESAFSTGGMQNVKQNLPAIQTIMKNAAGKQMNMMQAINKFSFMSSTRGKTHAVISSLTDFSLGKMGPEVLTGLAAMKFGEVKLAAMANTAQTSLLGPGSGSLLNILNPGLAGQLAGVGGLSNQNFAGTSIRALQQGRSTEQVAQDYQNQAAAGININSPLGQQINMIRTAGITGMSRNAIQPLTNDISPNADFGVLTSSLQAVNPTTNPAGYSAALNASSDYMTLYKQGKLAGMSDDKINNLYRAGPAGRANISFSALNALNTKDPLVLHAAADKLGIASSVAENFIKDSEGVQKVINAKSNLNSGKELVKDWLATKNDLPKTFASAIVNHDIGGMFSVAGTEINDITSIKDMAGFKGNLAQKYAQHLGENMGNSIIGQNPSDIAAGLMEADSTLRGHTSDVVAGVKAAQEDLKNKSPNTFGGLGSSAANPLWTKSADGSNQNTNFSRTG